MPEFWVFIMLWGVWLITPVLIDGLDAVARLVVVLTHRDKADAEPLDDAGLPTVSVVVPAHNEEAVIDRCLTSIKAQRYPHEKLEVIVIDDGSTDSTAEIAEAHANGSGGAGELVIRGQRIEVGPFTGRFLVIRNGHSGKSHALNTGIAVSTGEIIVNVDSDVTLAPDSIRAIAEAFVSDPEMGAATGDIEVDWELVLARAEDGSAVVDDAGLPVPKRLTLGERFLARSQFLEYLASFRLGRHAQGMRDTMFTLAGACSAFRRSAVADGFHYSNRTVSEDTDLTWELHQRGVRIGFVPRARVLLEPVTDWDELYAQRVRWARGQLEVTSLNRSLVDATGSRPGGATLPNMLLYDHTLAFPRFVWAPLMLFFPLLGYSPRLLAIVFVAMYVFYVLIEAMNTLSAYAIAESDTKARVERSAWTIVSLPAYRYLVFYFRFAGFLIALREEQQWSRTGGFGDARRRLDVARLKAVRATSAVTRSFALGWTLSVRVIGAAFTPLLLGLVVAFVSVLAVFRKDS